MQVIAIGCRSSVRQMQVVVAESAGPGHDIDAINPEVPPVLSHDALIKMLVSKIEHSPHEKVLVILDDAWTEVGRAAVRLKRYREYVCCNLFFMACSIPPPKRNELKVVVLSSYPLPRHYPPAPLNWLCPDQVWLKHDFWLHRLGEILRSNS